MGIQKSLKKEKPLLYCDLLISKFTFLNGVIIDPTGTHWYLTVKANKDCGFVATVTHGMTSNKRLYKSTDL